jgi:hypothetical protein
VTEHVQQLDRVIIAGDCREGMQPAGDSFTQLPATVGNDLSDLPAEIRAPGTDTWQAD